MHIRRFLADNLSEKNTVNVLSEEFFHLFRVLRKKEGDRIELINGRGVLARGEISRIEKNRAVVKIKQTIFEEKRDVETVLCPSILKRKAMDLMIEKLSEMGIDEIRPVIFERSDVKFKRESLKRWKKISLESLKVNGRLWPTEIYEPLTPDGLVEYAGKFSSKILFDIEGDTPRVSLNFPSIAVIGPPGDFTDNEKIYLQKNGFTSININDAVMKSDTAAISAAAIMNMYRVIEGK